MDSAAQPLTIGEILDRVYRLMRGNLRRFLALAVVPLGCFAVVFVAMIVILLLVSFGGHWPALSASDAALGSPAVFAAFTFLIVLGYLGYAIVYAIYQPAASYAALKADAGEGVSFNEAYAFVWSKAGRYIGLFLLRLLIIAGPVAGVILLLGGALLVAVRFAGSSAQAALLAIVPLLILIYAGGMVYGVFMMIRLALAYPACVAEDLTARAAIRRSMQLSRNAKGRIFVVALVVYAAIYAATMILEIVFGFVVAAIAVPMAFSQMSQTATIIGAVLAGLLVLVLILLISAVSSAAYATAFAVLYRDQRLRIDPRPPSEPEPEVAA